MRPRRPLGRPLRSGRTPAWHRIPPDSETAPHPFPPECTDRPRRSGSNMAISTDHCRFLRRAICSIGFRRFCTSWLEICTAPPPPSTALACATRWSHANATIIASARASRGTYATVRTSRTRRDPPGSSPIGRCRPPSRPGLSICRQTKLTSLDVTLLFDRAHHAFDRLRRDRTVQLDANGPPLSAQRRIELQLDRPARSVPTPRPARC